MSAKICIVEECFRLPHAKGYCASHYSRLKRHGDPKAGSTSPGEPSSWLENAFLLETDECIQWPYGKTPFGYGVLWVDGKLKGAHLVVCEKVHGPRPSPAHEAAHSCGNGHLGCINRYHIRWATISENQMERVKHGTSNRGERCASSKLTEAEVISIRDMAAQRFYSHRQIGELFGISATTVWEIFHRKTWYWLQSEGEAA